MMISRRNFAMITAIMLVVLFMFQATGIAKNHLNDAETNEYALKSRSAMGEGDAYSPDDKCRQIINGGAEDGASASRETSSNKRLVLFVGDEKESEVFDTIRQWCTYSKRALLPLPSVSDCADYGELAEILLIDSKALDLEGDVELLRRYVEQGQSLIFCNLPDARVVGEHVELGELLGITAIYDYDVELTGVHLFDGLLLGGERIYQAKEPREERRQDMDLTVPWYLTLNGNKSYMIGLLDGLKSQNGDIPDEYAPNLIWRTTGTDGGQVFVVNGDFMEDITGIGILEGMLSELHTYEIYPVVNAQNFSVVNYPSFAQENSEEIQKRYSRELPSLYRDVIWQSISSVTERGRSKTTALLAPQYDYEDGNEPSADAFTYYARLFREKRMEIGLSFEQISEIPLQEKIAGDISFLNENLKGYEYRSVYVPVLDEQARDALKSAEGLSAITTVLTDDDGAGDLLGYLDGKCIQRTTNDAFSHTYSENLRMRSIESALGYTSVILNMNRVAYPKTDADNWEKLYEEFSANLLTYWKDYADFEKTTLSESDVRVRRFLNLDFTESRENDTLTVAITNFENEAYFILRTHGESLGEVQGGSFLELEEDAYLIRAEAESLVIRLKDDDTLMYD